MCPASPQSMTRCAILMPGPATFAFSGCVDGSADWSTVYAHSQLKFRMFLERAAYFQRAFNRRFRAMIKNQRDAVARWDSEQPPRRFRDVEFISASDDLV